MEAERDIKRKNTRWKAGIGKWKEKSTIAQDKWTCGKKNEKDPGLKTGTQRRRK